MNLTSAILQKTYQESYLQYTESLNILKMNSLRASHETNDKVELSNDTLSIKDLGLKLTDSFVLQQNSNINFKYKFADSLIQVQSEGNYNVTERSGYVNFSVDVSQMLEKNANKLTVFPVELNISLDFNLVEKNYTRETGSSIHKPDMLTIIQKIVQRVVDITKDGQDKSIALLFENNDTLKELFQYEKGKFAKMILAWLEAISNTIHPNDKDGKRENVILLIPDEKWQIDYEKLNLSINISNISVEMKLKSGETQTIMLTDTESADQQTTGSENV